MDKFLKCLRRVFQAGVRLIYPPLCPLCQDVVEQDHMICGVCWPKVQYVTRPFCEQCATPLEAAYQDEKICARCLLTPPAYEQARASFVYTPEIKRLVVGYKNHNFTHLTPFMVHHIQRSAADILAETDILVPVPLHKNRLKARGYNQAMLLAKALGKAKGIPVLPLLERRRDTPSQGHLSTKKRYENVKNAINFNEKYKEFDFNKSTITLIDDVMTTGATLDVCAAVLKERDINRVQVVVLSRTML